MDIHILLLLSYICSKKYQICSQMFFSHSLCLPVIQCLVAMVNMPQPEHPLRADLAEEYTKDRAKFMKNAEEFTKKHSEKRPVDWRPAS